MFSNKNLLVRFAKSFFIVRTNYYLLSKNNSTFHKWILDYFRNQPYYNKFVLKQSITKSNHVLNNLVLLKTIPTDELLVKLLSTNIKFHHIIDCELENRVNSMSINQVLALMDACLSVNHQFIYSKSFKKCVEIMNEEWFRRPDLTASQTLQLIYYASIYKNKSKLLVEYGLQKLINDMSYLKQLSDEELSILAVSTYKSGAKVYDKILRIFVYRIENNINKLLQNPLLFISLIKPLKKAKYHDPILLNQLITAINNNNNNEVLKNVIGSIHLLTYFADANYGDVKFLQSLIDSIGDSMIEDQFENIRIKDVCNYLFSASYLGLSPQDNVCKIILNYLDKLFDTKEKFKKKSNMLIGICLSMWMLNYKPIKLMALLLPEISGTVARMSNAHKQNNRLNLLITCALIEEPELIMKWQLIKETINVIPYVHQHLGERPFLKKVFQTLQKLSHKLNISNVEYHFSIPYLKILGIKLIKNNSEVLHIEVLDNTTCLLETQIPNGMMKLKFRLASKLNFTVFTISQRKITSDNQMTLKCHLKSRLS